MYIHVLNAQQRSIWYHFYKVLGIMQSRINPGPSHKANAPPLSHCCSVHNCKYIGSKNLRIFTFGIFNDISDVATLSLGILVWPRHDTEPTSLHAVKTWTSFSPTNPHKISCWHLNVSDGLWEKLANWLEELPLKIF